MLAVYDGDQVAGTALQHRQQRPDVRPGSEHAAAGELERQRHGLEEAKSAAGKDRDGMTQAVSAPGFHQVPDAFTVGGAEPVPCCGRTAAVAASIRSLASAGRPRSPAGSSGTGR